MMELIDHMRLRRPEAARDRMKLRCTQALPPQHQHLRRERHPGHMAVRDCDTTRTAGTDRRSIKPMR